MTSIISNLTPLIHNLYVRAFSYKIKDFVHDRLNDAAIVAHQRKTQLRRLPGILIVHFRQLYLESIGGAILELPQHAALLLKRMACREIQVDLANAYHHGLQRRFLFLDDIGFDDVAVFDIVEVLQAYAALVVVRHLANVILEAFER